MIICSCNNISDKTQLKPFKTICGKCKSMENELSDVLILKTYKKRSLIYKESVPEQKYSIYTGYILLKSFNSYSEAREYFDKLKQNEETN
jgi:hypothetical protein